MSNSSASNRSSTCSRSPGLKVGLVGTLAYMSPEQACGHVDELDPASDIYSLGATLYAILTGRPPIEGKESLDVLFKARRGDWTPPRQVKPDVPAALDA